MEKLKRSGFSENCRKEVLEAGVKGYMAKVRRQMMGGERVNRNGNKDKAKKKRIKMTKRKDWYQYKEKVDNDTDSRGTKRHINDCRQRKEKMNNTKNSDSKVEAVIFVPITPKGY